MEQNIFFSALSTSLLTSIVQGLMVYVVVQILLRSAPSMSSENRFKFLYAGMLLILAGFVFSLVENYSAEVNTVQMFNSKLIVLSNLSVVEASNYSPAYPINFTKWIAGLYFTGVTVQAGLILAGFYQLQLFRAKNQVWNDTVWEKRMQILSKKLNIKKNVSLELAERVFSPFTAGFFKPVIIFPIAMLNRLSPEQVEAILLHELGHIKRNDYLFNILHKIIETLLFFNPFIWLLSKAIRREREFACDDLVMEYTTDTKQYARALLHIAESNLNHCAFGLAASGNDKYALLTRIKRLKNMKTHQNNPKSGLLALLSIAAAFVSLACIIPDETTIPQSSKNSTIKKIQIVYHAAGKEGTKMDQKPLNSIKNLKASLRDLPANYADTDTNQAKEYFKSAEWKKQMEDIRSHVAEMKKHFDSPEWKKHIADMKVNSEEMKKQFDSPEWKKQMQDIKIHSDEMKKHFDSPEWKKQMADLKINAEQMKSHALAMQKEFDSPEWKQKIEEMKTKSLEMKKQFDSPEWKKKIAEMKVSSEELKKQFESPEWKKQIEEIKKLGLEMKLEAEKLDKKPVKPIN